MKNIYYYSTFILCFVSCASYDLKVNSEPKGAKVFIKSEKEMTEVGVTPLVVPPEHKNRNVFQIVISKEGYHPQTVVIEKRTVSAEADVFASLDKIAPIEVQLSDPKVRGEMQKVSRQVASIQSELIKRNYDSAEGMAKDLLNEYPHFAVGWSLLGNAHYLRNRQGDALEAYKKALEYDPENIETKNLVESMDVTRQKGDR
jgi:tetratricopeptide (TPR) repeat protein